MFYRRYIKNHFFGKILILYLLITLFSGVVLFITLSDNLMRDQERGSSHDERSNLEHC